MKKENMYKFLYGVCIFLVLAFCIRVVGDYFQYDKLNNSAPFYVFIIVRIVEFILPSILVFIAARMVKKKYNK